MEKIKNEKITKEILEKTKREDFPSMLYVTSVAVALLLFAMFMPKHIQRRNIIIIFICVSYINQIVDLYLGNILKLYYSVSPEIRADVVTLKLFKGALFGIVFLNFMPKRFSRFMPYWLLWVAFSIVFEWSATYFGYLMYTRWKLWYSAIFYVLIFPSLRWFYYKIILHKDLIDD